MNTVIPNYNNFGAIILAGGKSRRFGSNKELCIIDGIPLIQKVIDVAKSITKNITIVSNKPENLNFISFPKYKDIIPNIGPLGGIYTGLVHSEMKLNLILACDIPNISTEFLIYLISNVVGNEITVPCHTNNMLEPLCAIYSKTCIPYIKSQIEVSEYQVVQIYDRVKTKKLPITPNYSNQFFNINSKHDLLQCS